MTDRPTSYICACQYWTRPADCSRLWPSRQPTQHTAAQASGRGRGLDCVPVLAMTSKLEQAMAKLVLAAEAGSERLVVVSHDGLPVEAAALVATLLRRVSGLPSRAGQSGPCAGVLQ